MGLVFLHECAMATPGDIGIEQLLNIQAKSRDESVLRTALPCIYASDAATALADHVIQEP